MAFLRNFQILLSDSPVYPMVVSYYRLTVDYYCRLSVGYYCLSVSYCCLTVSFHYLTVSYCSMVCWKLLSVAFAFLIFLDNTNKMAGYLFCKGSKISTL